MEGEAGKGKSLESMKFYFTAIIFNVLSFINFVLCYNLIGKSWKVSLSLGNIYGHMLETDRRERNYRRTQFTFGLIAQW